MCGISVQINDKNHRFPSNEALKLLCARGPDYSASHECTLKSTDEEDLCISFFSSVLRLRGSELVQQPLVDGRSGSVLCWNGEAWGIAGVAVTGSDSRAVFDLLLAAATAKDRPEAVIEALSSITGPAAFVFFDGNAQRLYYGRDSLGRRSLLRCAESHGGFALSSIAPPQSTCAWSEVDAGNVYMLDLSCRLPSDRVEATLPELCCLETWFREACFARSAPPSVDRAVLTSTDTFHRQLEYLYSHG